MHSVPPTCLHLLKWALIYPVSATPRPVTRCDVIACPAVEWDAIHRPEEIKKFSVLPEMNHNVAILRIFPGITQATVSD